MPGIPGFPIFGQNRALLTGGEYQSGMLGGRGALVAPKFTHQEPIPLGDRAELRVPALQGF